ncbi:hypothetical protein JQC91_12160 [Jannaschia sp. Os4]|uniref:hypothetical protein n=1 Tax=Jannaschia sp. Os4 TaxID=2807617 RepID=UPI00193A326F|nr:hypothetical protein [Jannaschia sp. Os4]MBM2577052.1 hypothetical protein [Jannaschia sp. Os4]
MSNPDSFIDEVTEELRRDRMSMLLRRWGWVAVLAVALLVGGAAFNEWRKARDAARAQAFGDAVLAALELPDAEARSAALAALEPAVPEQRVVLEMARAGSLAEADPAAAAAALIALGDDAGVAPEYRDLALLKAIWLGGSGDAARDAAILADLATPGRPFRTLAVEQQAFAAIAAGDPATAATLLRVLTEDAEASQALRQRARQTIVALGLEAEPA